MYSIETVARARELLSLQDAGTEAFHYCTEAEAKRFLLASKLNVELAAQGLARRARAREEGVDVSTIDFGALRLLLPLHWSRNSKKSLIFGRFGAAFDAKKFLEAIGPNNGKMFFQWLGEIVSQKCDAAQERLNVILDFTGASIAQTANIEFDSLVRFGALVLQSLFPERLEHVFCINTPANFSIIMYEFKRVCSAETMKKIVLLDSAMQLPPAVLKQEFVPRYLGGTQKKEWTDEDSVYSSLVSHPSPPQKASVETSTNQSLSVTASSSLQDEVEHLLNVFESCISKAELCEKMHLTENTRLRRKLKQLEASRPQSADPEEAELAQRLQETLSERDAYRRAVVFARNFIEQDMEERLEFKNDIESEIEQKRRENLALVDVIKNAFGPDTPNLLL